MTPALTGNGCPAARKFFFYFFFKIWCLVFFFWLGGWLFPFLKLGIGVECLGFRMMWFYRLRETLLGYLVCFLLHL